MTVRTDVDLTNLAAVIRNEASAGANTAVRVGDFLKDLVDSKLNIAGTPAAPGSNNNLLFNNGGVIGAISFVNTTGAASDALAFGSVAGAATTGHLRFEHNKTLVAGRNQAGTQNVPLMRWGNFVNDVLYFGTSSSDAGKAAGMRFGIHTGGSFIWEVNGVSELEMSSTVLDLKDNVLQMGTNPATGGHIRGPNGFLISARNAANTANVNALNVGGDNVVYIGDGVNNPELDLDAAGLIDFKIAGVIEARLSNTTLDLTDNVLQFGTNPAASGLIRVAHGATILNSRNQTNNGDINVLRSGANGNNSVTLGGTTVTGGLFYSVSSGTTHAFLVNNVLIASVTSTTIALEDNIALKMGATNTAAGGLIRFPNNTSLLVVRNAANTQDIIAIRVDSANSVILGQDTNMANVVVRVPTSQLFQILVNNVLEYDFDGTRLDCNGNSVEDVNFFASSSTPATTGTVRLGNTQTIYFRNAANSANLRALSVSSGDDLLVGSGDAHQQIFYNLGNSSGFHIFQINSTNEYSMSSTTFDMNGNNIANMGNLDHNGTTAGFFSTTPTTKQTVTGSRGGNAALASLLTGLAAYGFVTDSSTA